MKSENKNLESNQCVEKQDSNDFNVDQLIGKYQQGLIKQSTQSLEKNDFLKSTQLFENKFALSIAETAFRLGLSSRTVERLIARGEIKAKKAGRRWLITPSSLEAWLNSKE